MKRIKSDFAWSLYNFINDYKDGHFGEIALQDALDMYFEIEPKTRVVFRKFKDGQIIALFPDSYKDGMIDTYMHIGQHSLGDPRIVDNTKLATSDEYYELKKELERIGYNLVVRKKLNIKY